MLGFAEPVDFVYEEDGVFGVEESLGFGFFYDFSHVFDSGVDGGEGEEGSVGLVGDDVGESGFAYSGGAPEEHGGDVTGFDGSTEDTICADEVFLTDVVV